MLLAALSLGLVPQPGGLVLRKMCPAASRAAVPVAQAEDKGWDGEFREMPVEKATPLTDARRKAARWRRWRRWRKWRKRRSAGTETPVVAAAWLL